MRTRWWRWVVLLVFAIGLGACGLKQGFEDTKRTTAALKSELGLDAGVSFHTRNGHTTVQVHLASPPPGDVATLKANVTAVVNRTFHAKVERVELSF